MSRRTITTVIAALSGALFGAGLLVSGMTRPAIVVGFLDVTRGWDPRLAFVMAGALTVYAATTLWIRARGGAPWLADAFHLPASRKIDRRLVAGAALFGIGWGLSGVCPGPAIVSSLASGASFVFIVAMLAGMYLHQVVTRGASRRGRR